jgi:hypothetical protein
MIGKCEVKENLLSGFWFRFRQQPGLWLFGSTLTGLGFVGALTIIKYAVRQSETIVLEPYEVFFLFAFSAGARFILKAYAPWITFDESGVDMPGRRGHVHWNNVLGICILRQEGDYVELYLDWLPRTNLFQSITSRCRYLYVAGYVVEASADLAAILERFAGSEKLLEVPEVPLD